MEGFIAGACVGGAIGLTIGWVGLLLYKRSAEFWKEAHAQQREISEGWRGLLGDQLYHADPVAAAAMDAELVRRGLIPFRRTTH